MCPTLSHTNVLFVPHLVSWDLVTLPITPARLLQWLTGQGHVPLLASEKKDFRVVIDFNHDCTAKYGDHSICYPIVHACAKTIELPVKHMTSYQFKTVLTEAFILGQEFNNV